jgi:hypothetical protein
MRTLILTIVLASAALAEHVTPPAESPGKADSAVTQANIKSTICVRGYTKTVRPPVTYTNKLKRKLMATLHLPGAPRDYELDHRIPLEVGGCGRCTANLWMEPLDEARRKDLAENALHAAVCSGTMSLLDAQNMIVENWEGAVPK